MARRRQRTPFAGGKGTIMEGGMRVPVSGPLAGTHPGRQGRGQRYLLPGLDFFPTLTAIGGDANIKEELLEGQAARRQDL